MKGGLSQSQISAAFITACFTEVRALKPGNVHVYAGGHGMQVADFEASAKAAAPHIADASLKPGERIRRAVEATFAAVSCNTNLGILLLCAPLAVAAERSASEGSLRTRLKNVLAGLDQDDTANVFQAIAAASPGGLGTDATSDVRRPPPENVTLLDAMRMASDRDLIAHEYITDFARILDLHDKEFAPRLVERWSAEDAITRVFVHALARYPDTHVARKHGAAVADEVRAAAQAFEDSIFRDPERRPSDPAAQAALLEFDAELKSKGVNPGSLADIMAAILFVSALNRKAPQTITSQATC